MFAKNGFQNVAVRVKLGRFLLERFSNFQMEQYSPAERLRMSFEQLGPTFVKLGQLLATRPDLVPAEFVEEFKKLHDQVPGVPFEQIRDVLEKQFGASLTSVFSEFNETPLAAASIAQVHRARLVDGSEVVVKVQRPGIAEVIAEDINVLYFLAELLQKYVPETRPYNPIGIVDEFFKTLQQETNFVIEANNIRRFRENFASDPAVCIPRVYFEYSGKNILVMEALPGLPLSHPLALQQEGVDPVSVVRAGLRCYFKMVFRDGFFHGDLHAGNLFILPKNRIGLIDFGIVGRLNRRTQDAIANMFLALYTENYERLAYEYVELAPYNSQLQIEEFGRDLQSLLSPYFGVTMKNVNLGRLLMDTTVLAARHHLVVPTELMLFFKSIVTVEGMGRMVVEDFDLLSHALEFAGDLAKTRFEPQRVTEDVSEFVRDSTDFIQIIPRQLKQLVRKFNDPAFSIRLSISEVEELREGLETSGRTVFRGLLVAGLLLSATGALFLKDTPLIFGLPAISVIAYTLAGLLCLRR